MNDSPNQSSPILRSPLVLTPISLICRTFVQVWDLLFFVSAKGGAPEGGGPERWGARRVGGPEGWGPEGWGPEGWGPKISRFFFPFPPPFRSFCVSLGVFSWNFGGVWSAGALKCARLEFSGCRVRAPAARSVGAAGVSHDSPRAQTCTLDEIVVGWNCLGWKCHWMRVSKLDESVLDESVIGWNRVWMKVSVDEIDFGWKCILPLWMTKKTDHFLRDFVRSERWFWWLNINPCSFVHWNSAL